MKQFKVVLMLLMLVTFSTGFGKTTADLTKNSKTELVQRDLFATVAVDFVSVVPFESMVVKPTLFISNEVVNQTLFIQDNFKTNHLAIIRDVGWRNSRINYKQLAYKEKMLDSLKNQSKNKLVKLEPRIQDNPFSNSISIPIYNYRC